MQSILDPIVVAVLFTIGCVIMYFKYISSINRDVEPEKQKKMVRFEW